MTDIVESLCARWGHHFEGILNVQSQFGIDIVSSMPSHHVQHNLDTEPTLEELQCAIRRMKHGMTG